MLNAKLSQTTKIDDYAMGKVSNSLVFNDR